MEFDGKGTKDGRAQEAIVAGIVMVVCFVVFRFAPVQQLHDSRYTMLLSESVVKHGDLDLARYHLPADDYHLRPFGAHRFYYFPEAPAVLSAPLVALFRLRGLSAIKPDGTYDEAGERALDKRVAAALMAAFAAVVYVTARLLLPEMGSLALVGTAAFGTQVFSTASRSVWSDSWGILLASASVLLLLHAAARRQPVRGAWLGGLLALAYVVRPTNALALVAVGAHLLWSDRRAVVGYAAAAFVVLAVFLIHTRSELGAWLPPYFAGDRLEFRTPGVAVAGNLVSPSRGLLVYVPAVVALALALVRYRRALRFRGLLALGAAIVSGHFVVLAGFWDWWGGHSYGPRLTASLVPWLVLFAVVAVAAARETTRTAGDRALGAAAGALCLASMALNAVGACSWEADRWNVVPDNINDDRDRLWSWSRPQFLAPFVPPPPSADR